MRTLTIATFAVAAALVAAPASAALTTIAEFAPIANSTVANFNWVVSAPNVNGGRNATFYSTTTGVANAPGARQVNFSFVNVLSAFVQNETASFLMNGTVTNTVATVGGGNITQTNVNGSFSFLSTAPIFIGNNTTLAAGSNLLSGTFSTATISGARNGATADFDRAGTTSAISYTSDFLTFAPGSTYAFALDLTAINPGLNALPTGGTPTRALRSFRAVLDGALSSDPVPTVPEPAVWAQLILGFGLVGAAARRRKVTVTA